LVGEQEKATAAISRVAKNVEKMLRAIVSKIHQPK
jgi:hypothetical protein